MSYTYRNAHQPWRVAACAAVITAAAVPSLAVAQPSNCGDLLGVSLPTARIISADAIPAGTYQPPGNAAPIPDLPAFCRITATLNPVPESSVGIEVWLPSSTWNGRYQQVGQHGWGGTIYRSEMAPQLRRGFATAATDGGHSSAGGFDVSWAFNNPEAITDFAYRSVHELAGAAKQVVAAFYGQPPQYAYYNGCSDGGRDGMKSAQMFPQDFNGIIAGGAAAYWTYAATQQLIVTKNLQQTGITNDRGASILNLEQDAVTKACDPVDGVADGVVANPKQCRWSPLALTCKPGQNPAACVTPAQAVALQANDLLGTPSGSGFDQIQFGFNKALSPFALSNYQIVFNDPNWNGSTFNLVDDLPRLDRQLGVMNALDPDLKAFQQAGGKLIEWQGLEDSQFPPAWTEFYYDQVVAATGAGDASKVGEFYRLFMLPSMGHCARGDGPINIGAENQLAASPDPEHDVVSALLHWVEQGRVPDQLIATKFTNDDPEQGIAVQRPICPYPSTAIYKGTGSTNDAENFACSPSQQ